MEKAHPQYRRRCPNLQHPPPQTLRRPPRHWLPRPRFRHFKPSTKRHHITTYRRSKTPKMAGISVGGRFFNFECYEINLYGLNLSESELLRLLECINPGNFTNLMTLMMVIAAKWVLQLFFDVFDAGWTWYWGQRRGDDRGGADGEQQPEEARSCKAIEQLVVTLILSFRGRGMGGIPLHLHELFVCVHR